MNKIFTSLFACATAAMLLLSGCGGADSKETDVGSAADAESAIQNTDTAENAGSVAGTEESAEAQGSGQNAAAETPAEGAAAGTAP